jgi:3'-5' exoribonuclease
MEHFALVVPEFKRKMCSLDPIMAKENFISDFKENESLVSCFLVKAKTLSRTRTGNPFLKIRLADRTGETEGRIWERAQELDPHFSVNDVVRVRATVERYQDKLQLNIAAIDRLEPNEIDPRAFLPASPEDPEELWQQLKKLASQVRNHHLQNLLQAFLSDRSFVREMKLAPAAKSIHHAYLGGLLEHTVSVARLLGRLCDHYPQLDRDLLITAALLHDVGKLEELTYQQYFDYSDAGRLLGHIVLGTQRIKEKISKIKDFPQTLSLSLLHLIVSHHGELEFGSPKRPKTLEAFALHYADDLDGKINHLTRLLEAEKEDPSHWTTFQRIFDRYMFKGNAREDLSPQTPAVGPEDEGEPRNYSFLDQLAGSTKKEPG